MTMKQPIFTRDGEIIAPILGMSTTAFVFLLCLTCCSSPDAWEYRPDPYRMHTRIINGCHYIEVGVPGSREYSLTHRGDCPNHHRP